MQKLINANRDRFSWCAECDFNICDNKCLSMLENLQIEDDYKHLLMERFS